MGSRGEEIANRKPADIILLSEEFFSVSENIEMFMLI
jgi:hypothetical protein